MMFNESLLIFPLSLIFIDHKLKLSAIDVVDVGLLKNSRIFLLVGKSSVDCCLSLLIAGGPAGCRRLGGGATTGGGGTGCLGAAAGAHR
eukprot:1212383-Amphidinium_carterae.1